MNPARQAMLGAGTLIPGHFVFADGDHAALKLEADKLWDDAAALETILQLLAAAEGLPPADLILGVPTGGQRLAIELGQRGLVSVPVVLLERVPGAAKQDFRFTSRLDEELVCRAQSIRIYEDVVSTLSSIAGVVRLLDPTHQAIDSLAIWRRGQVKERYRTGVCDHYLVEEEIPSFSAPDCPICRLTTSG